MLQSEFEQLTGKRIAPQEYAQIEKVYMSAPDSWRKEDFCIAVKGIKETTKNLLVEVTEHLTAQNNRLTIKKQNAEHDLEMKQREYDILKSEYQTVTIAKNEIAEECDQLALQNESLAVALLANGMDNQAIEILGHSEVIRIKCKLNMELYDNDRAYLANYFKK